MYHYGVVKADRAEFVEDGGDAFISLEWKDASAKALVELCDSVGNEDVWVREIHDLPASFQMLTNVISKFKHGFTEVPHYGLDYTVSIPEFPKEFTSHSPHNIGKKIRHLLQDVDVEVYVLGNYTYSDQTMNYVRFNNYFVGEESVKDYSNQDGAVLVHKNGVWNGLFFAYQRQVQAYIRVNGDAATVPDYPGRLYMACGIAPVDTKPAETAKLLELRELPQQAVTTYPTSYQTFITVYLKPGYVRDEVVDALVKVPRTYPHGCIIDPNVLGIFFYVDWLQGQNPNDRLELNIGFSPKLWIEWKQSKPKNMVSFHSRTTPDNKSTMPATGGDIMLHLKGSRPELLLDISNRFAVLIKDQQEKLQVFNTYNGPSGRNHFGFIDAPTSSLPPCGLYQRVTQNPVMNFGPIESVTDRGRTHVSLIGSEDEDHKNGSFMLSQLYLFKMDKFNKLSEPEQSEVFGRDKETGYFLNSAITNANDPAKIPMAHVIRSSISLNDPPTKFAHIYRQAGSYSDPSGTPGLFFVAYVSDCNLFDKTLDQMMGLVKPNGKPQGVDTMMEYVETISGQYFYVPNLTRLFRLWSDS